MDVKKINKCAGGHYFLDDKCPYRNKEIIAAYEVREGDCIACGQLCPDGGYACNTPSPINK